MDRPPQSLESLPLLVLERIGYYVDDEGDTTASNGDNRASLSALSLVSRRCAAAMEVQRFCQLHVRLVERDTIQETVGSLLAQLGEKKRHVRRLRVSGGTTKNAAEFRARTGEIPPVGYDRGRGEGGRWHEAYNEEAGPGRSGDVDDPLGRTHNSGWDTRSAFASDESSSFGGRQGGRDGRQRVCIHPFCRPRWARKSWLEEEVYGLTHDHNTMTMVHDKDPAWNPVVLLIQSLPGLRDLVWNCATYLPEVVLQALQAAPTVRLHMHQFVLHSLTQFVHHRRQSNISARDYTLATSPQLVSLVAQVNRRLLMGRVNHTSDALPQLMCGLAPNLQHVWIDEVSPNPFFSGVGWGEDEEDDDDDSDEEGGIVGANAVHGAEQWARDLPKWQGFFPEGTEGIPETNNEDDKPAQTPKGVISLVLWRDITARTLNNVLVRSGVDLTCLRHLTLFWRQRTVLQLIKLCRSRHLVALDHFTLLQATDGVWIELKPDEYTPGEYGSPDDPDSGINTGECIQVVSDDGPGIIDINLNNVLFRNLPPLRHLHYTGALLHTTARRIYKTHGATLRYLVLHTPAVPPHSDDDPFVWLTYMDKLAIQEKNDLASMCPNLEELRINMRRTRGNAEEVAVYKALARLPRLERLFVKLHYRITFKRPPNQTSGEELAVRRHGYRAGQVPFEAMEDVYSNCALDATLARAIYDVIDAGRGRLRHLRLDIQREAGVQDVGMDDYAFMDMLRWLARPQTIRRTTTGEIVVTQTNTTATKIAQETWAGLGGNEEPDETFRPEKHYKLQNCRNAFRSVWPPKRKTNWWHDWTSLPLEMGEVKE
ncbi:hypothetical protein SEUCBS140593_007252 [Sporothrix eucalyptigena]|uniref:F-box domain-containing protein n=1 Tax=Sporothrix eucalyptigena TaxID=1812306 RepID=A0ABP0CDC8_9PEZI